MLENSFLWIHQFCQFPEIHEKLFSSIFMNISVDEIIVLLVYLILKVLAWEIFNMNQEFAKKAIIKSQWQFIFATNFYETDVMYRVHWI